MEKFQLAHTGKELDDALDIFMDGFKTEELNVAENGSYVPSKGVHGFSEVNVNVQPPLEEITITGPGEYTPSEGMYGISKVIADVGPKDGPLELVYETEFSIEETVTENNTNFLTIEPNFNVNKAGDSYCALIRCINDKEADTTIVHFIERTDYFGLTDGGYQGGVWAGFNRSSKYVHYGQTGGVSVYSITNFLASIKLAAFAAPNSRGCAVAGDYSFKLYKFNHDYFELGV